LNPVDERFPSLSLPRVLALVGGLSLVAAYFMPWFSSQGLLLSGQFLHIFLGNPGDLRRFLPGASGAASETMLLRALVDLFPACGAVATVATLVGGLWRRLRTPTNAVVVASAIVPLVAWALGTTRLPPGASIESGMWLMLGGAIAVLLGLGIELLPRPP
jgi:hypothetical protein